jgi:hypothetical protein
MTQQQQQKMRGKNLLSYLSVATKYHKIDFFFEQAKKNI